MKNSDKENTNGNLSKPIDVVGRGLQKLAIVPSLHWLFTRQEQVNSFQTACARGNLRYFSGRAAVGLFFTGALARISAKAIEAYGQDLEEGNGTSTELKVNK